jgi:hypothetical protein
LDFSTTKNFFAMFTDDAVTPVRLEILIDLLRKSRGGLAREEIYRHLQPEALKPDSKLAPSKATVRAALDLELLAEETQGTLSLRVSCKKKKDTRSAVLSAFDEKALANTKVEKYFALFYSYYLGLGKAVYSRAKHSGEEWAKQFNADVFSGEPQDNPFNATKLTGLHRWFSYVGLGWYDPASNFQANPYERVLRALPTIFSGVRKLSSGDFMNQLARTCPELDGGEIFRQANRNWKSEDKQCSLGLSHAMIELHEDGVIALDCPADNQDWSLKEAEPPRDDQFKGDRFSSIKWRNK